MDDEALETSTSMHIQAYAYADKVRLKSPRSAQACTNSHMYVDRIAVMKSLIEAQVCTICI